MAELIKARAMDTPDSKPKSKKLICQSSHKSVPGVRDHESRLGDRERDQSSPGSQPVIVTTIQDREGGFFVTMIHDLFRDQSS